MTTLKKTTSGETPHTNSIIVRNLGIGMDYVLKQKIITNKP